MIQLECDYDDHTHDFPDDWILGGANGLDPRADPRWQPTTYFYMNAVLETVHLTQTPLCDWQALDEFTKVSGWGDLSPVYLSVRRPGEEKETVLPWIYDQSKDTYYPYGESSND